MLASILHYEFLQNAFLAGIIIGLIAPLLGVFVVVRRLSLIADALSHVTLAGIAGSLYLSQTVTGLATLNPLYLGITAAVGGSMLIEKLRRLYKHFEELAIPIIMSAGLGMSAIFISLAQGFSTDLFSYLFGSVSAVSRQDLYIVIGIALIVILFIFLVYKELFVLSFDDEYAKASGLPTKVIHTIFMIITALVIAASMRIVGILLVSSLITLPVAASIRIAKSFKQTIVYSIVFGELAVIIGLVSAFYLNLAPGGTIVITSIIILLIVLIGKKISKAMVARTE
ncbi:metal ABC transporter permease [Kurthia zopfii]|uniref:High-affinity zinc uptake system membrane protein znuB n=1 Tax=Kurthia zopfii TaxID=1650 RepID=A0A2U3A9J5_9BACL|nr:metal ABC transporter permease [Kurthia zopfii]PWI21223.1 metal ABC transporter permease [Kurthia zopfii]TDR33695.1 zinc transport system permease protein [Kurthia zopfii]STX10030.1 High-affinity zinc uptake system membrane protein znuB [Kurthia zopfii]VEI07641.1 High-affinity zinc uptake system membrane protein znuB [Kurthia zopfii]GEK32054.1 metal ABC transporter permease [Kurthia zopfii]